MSAAKRVDDQPFLVDGEPKSEFIPEAGSDFVVTPYIQDLTDRAIAYLTIGYAVHLSGPAGTGKSTLAMHIASQLGRACTLLHGDDEFKASDLLGRDTGYQRNSTVDNYVSSIVKTEETMSVVWTSNRLTTACQKGHTLIYDEFTRSPATANNPFLSILEEGILNIPSSGKQKGYIKVHPNFRAIFTSNPEEYVGVHKTQDALLDRMITMRLDYQDRDTEAAIVTAKSGRSLDDAEAIVDIVRAFRTLMGGMNGPTVRAAIAIARILDHRKTDVDPDAPVFMTTCKDVLYFHLTRQSDGRINEAEAERVIRNLGRDCEEAPQPAGATDSVATIEAAPPTEAPSGDDTSNSQPIAPADTTFDAAASVGAANRVTEETPSPRVTPEDRVLNDALDLERSVADHLKFDSAVDSHSEPPRPSSASRDALPRPPLANLEPPLAELEPPLTERPAVVPATDSEPDTIDRVGSETASPQQMLEAAMARFSRPPTLGPPATQGYLS